MDETIRKLGRKLGLDVIRSQERPKTAAMRYGTITAVNADGSSCSCDVLVNGATLRTLPMTTDCLGAAAGDRCVVETFGRLSAVTGILARPTTLGRRLFEWSSTWGGTPSGEPNGGYVEKTATISHPGGLLLCEVAAAVGGTGEYCMALDFRRGGARKAYWCSTSPQKNGGTLRWTASGTVLLDSGDYDVSLTSYHWGTVEIVGNDSSGNSLKWRDAAWGAENGASRYARITLA